MLKEIIIEAIVLAVMAIIAHNIGLRKVKLVDRPVRRDFIIEPPVRKEARVKHAVALRKQFVRRNKWAEVESESLIVLPSVSFNWAIGAITGIIMMVMLCVNHIDGMAEIGRSAEHSIFYDYMLAVGIFFVISLGIAGWVAEKIIPDAAKARAYEIASTRTRKGRTARFVQDYSIDELPERAEWAYQERKAERAESEAERARRMAAREAARMSTNSCKVVNLHLPLAANQR